jgi:hypothetical protein
VLLLTLFSLSLSLSLSLSSQSGGNDTTILCQFWHEQHILPFMSVVFQLLMVCKLHHHVFAGSILNYPDPLPASMKVISLLVCLFVLGFSTSSHILHSKFKLQTKHFNSENWIFN